MKTNASLEWSGASTCQHFTSTPYILEHVYLAGHIVFGVVFSRPDDSYSVTVLDVLSVKSKVLKSTSLLAFLHTASYFRL